MLACQSSLVACVLPSSVPARRLAGTPRAGTYARSVALRQTTARSQTAWAAGAAQQQRQRAWSSPLPAAREKASTSNDSINSAAGGSRSSAAKAASVARQLRTGDGRFSGSTSEPQPRLQAWLQQEHGLPVDKADRYVRRFATAFGNSEDAALAGLPRVFSEFRSRGLSGAEVAWTLDAMAFQRHDSVTSIDGALRVWQLLDYYITPHVQRQQMAGRPSRKRSCVADMLRRENENAAQALAVDPVQAEASAAALCQRLAEAGSAAPEADVGSMLLKAPHMLTSPPSTLLAAMDWAADELTLTDIVAFFLASPYLLKYKVSKLRQKLVDLQAAGLTAEQARQLAADNPYLLALDLSMAHVAAAWLRQLFPAPEQLWVVVESCPRLLSILSERLQHTAAFLQQRLGWDDARLAAELQRRPSTFAQAKFDHPDTEAKVLFLTALGVDPLDCFDKHRDYLTRGLNTAVAQYVLLRERAPQLLMGRRGQPSLAWMKNKQRNLEHCGLTSPEYNAHQREWPQSEEGRRVLADLRSGSTKSLLLMPAHSGCS